VLQLFQVSGEELQNLEVQLSEVLQEYEEIYYRKQQGRVSVCTSQFHVLAHFAQSIRYNGPAPIYRQYTMERVCGDIKKLVKNKASSNVNIS
ncbi:hypothetical protein EDC01DRAFT_593937, partial [Geopyxis carbonaria]